MNLGRNRGQGRDRDAELGLARIEVIAAAGDIGLFLHAFELVLGGRYKQILPENGGFEIKFKMLDDKMQHRRGPDKGAGFGVFEIDEFINADIAGALKGDDGITLNAM